MNTTVVNGIAHFMEQQVSFELEIISLEIISELL